MTLQFIVAIPDSTHVQLNDSKDKCVAKNRREAIQKMQSALGEVIIEGVDTNVNYQYALLNHPDFLAGNIDIEFIDRIQQEA